MSNRIETRWREPDVTPLRNRQQMLGRDLRPPATGSPNLPAVSPAAGVNCYADATRYRSPVAGHTLGAQNALIPDHVRNCLGCRIAFTASGTGRRLPQRPGKATGHS